LARHQYQLKQFRKKTAIQRPALAVIMTGILWLVRFFQK
jgi:hypothetical protein